MYCMIILCCTYYYVEVSSYIMYHVYGNVHSVVKCYCRSSARLRALLIRYICPPSNHLVDEKQLICSLPLMPLGASVVLLSHRIVGNERSIKLIIKLIFYHQMFHYKNIVHFLMTGISLTLNVNYKCDGQSQTSPISLLCGIIQCRCTP